MSTVILIVHIMIAVALVGVILLQRSEGGALGMGGGGAGGFMTGRGTANMLTRVTAGLAAGFFLTSICLTLLAQQTRRAPSPLDRPAAGGPAVPGTATKTDAPATAPGSPPGAPSGGLLDSLQKGREALPQVPAGR